MMEIKPFGKNILVKPVERGGVLVTDDKEFTDTGEVIAVGDLVVHIKVGDKIGYLHWGRQKLYLEGDQEAYLIPETDEFILCQLIGNNQSAENQAGSIDTK